MKTSEVIRITFELAQKDLENYKTVNFQKSDVQKSYIEKIKAILDSINEDITSPEMVAVRQNSINILAKAACKEFVSKIGIENLNALFEDVTTAKKVMYRAADMALLESDTYNYIVRIHSTLNQMIENRSDLESIVSIMELNP